MTSITEAASGLNSGLNSVLTAGLETLDLKDEVIFTKYVRCVLPLDGFIFWVNASILSSSSVLNTSPLNSFKLNQDQVIAKAAPTVTVQGSFHYATDHMQNADETFDRNQVIFTAESDVDEFNIIAPNTLWIGVYDGVRFAFSHRKPLYKQAGIYHYIGDAIYPAMSTQIIDDPRFFDNQSLIVSNSMPIWLALNEIMPIYPAFLAEQNIDPDYATVLIDPLSQESLQLDTYVDQNTNCWQLVKENLKFTIYGLRNEDAIRFQRYIIDSSLNGQFGIMNSPIIKDEIRTQAEMSVIAQKKSFELTVNYYQQAALNIAREMIESVSIDLLQYPQTLPGKQIITGKNYSLPIAGISTGLGALSGIIPMNYPNINTFGFNMARSWDNGFIWSNMNTSNGVYVWTLMDEWVNAYYGKAKLIYVLCCTPQWASARPNEPGIYGNGTAAEPSNYAYLTTFVTALMTRYGSKIDYIECWNEPNGGWFSGSYSALSEIVRTINQAAKAITPTVKLISPACNNMMGPGIGYYNGMISASDGASGIMSQWIDIVGFHLYCQSQQHGIVAQTAVNLAASLNKPVFDTENGAYPAALTDQFVIDDIMNIYTTNAYYGIAATCIYQSGAPTLEADNSLFWRTNAMNVLGAFFLQLEEYGFVNPVFNLDGSISVYINNNFYQF